MRITRTKQKVPIRRTAKVVIIAILKARTQEPASPHLDPKSPHYRYCMMVTTFIISQLAMMRFIVL
jgi:hypothetical protein